MKLNLGDLLRPLSAENAGLRLLRADNHRVIEGGDSGGAPLKVACLGGRESGRELILIALATAHHDGRVVYLLLLRSSLSLLGGLLLLYLLKWLLLLELSLR